MRKGDDVFMKKLMCFSLAIMLMAGIASGCQKQTDGGTTAIQAGDEFSYPIETDEKLQFWYVDYTCLLYTSRCV